MRFEAPVTTYVIQDRLPWPDDDVARVGQAHFLQARVHGRDGVRYCGIQRISSQGAAVNGEALGESGSAVAIELSSGQPCAATIDWARGREPGLRFNEPIDVIALINRNLVAQPKERRAVPRIELRAAAHLKWGEHLEGVVTRNISARGMHIEGTALPPIDTYCAVFVEGLTLPPCDFVWRRNGLAGLEFFEELSWASIIRWGEAGGAKPVDSMSASASPVAADEAVLSKMHQRSGAVLLVSALAKAAIRSA